MGIRFPRGKCFRVPRFDLLTRLLVREILWPSAWAASAGLPGCWLPASFCCACSGRARLAAAPAPAPGALNRMAIWAGPAIAIPPTALAVGSLPTAFPDPPATIHCSSHQLATPVPQSLRSPPILHRNLLLFSLTTSTLLSLPVVQPPLDTTLPDSPTPSYPFSDLLRLALCCCHPPRRPITLA